MFKAIELGTIKISYRFFSFAIRLSREIFHKLLTALFLF